jgi:hypothetical protein
VSSGGKIDNSVIDRLLLAINGAVSAGESSDNRLDFKCLRAEYCIHYSKWLIKALAGGVVIDS